MSALPVPIIRLRPRTFLALLAVLLTLPLVACVQRPMAPIDERYDVESLATARINVENGSVTVAEGRAGQILVTGEHADGVSDYVATVAAGEARFEIKRRRSIVPGLGQRSARIEVVVPPGTTVEVESSNGSVEVIGAFVVNRVHTSNGPISIARTEGNLTLETSNGRVSVERHSGALVIRNSNGPVNVVEQRGGATTIDTSNGSINYQGTLDPGTENSMQTSSAAIEVQVSGTPSFTLDASTSNAGVTSRFALLDGSKGESRLTGRVGEGQARLLLRSSNGPIQVR